MIKIASGFFLIILAVPVFAQGVSLGLAPGTSCSWQTDKDSGTVIMHPGCDASMAKYAIEQARKNRTPNAGDFLALSQKLDRIIELLEKR